MAAGVFQYFHRVTYADCTIGNHIYYSRYLDLLEAARGEFFRHLGTSLLSLQDSDLIFPVIECRIRYRKPARYDDFLTIELWLGTAEKVRLNFGCRILDQTGALILEGETFHVCTGLNEKPKRIPGEFLDRVREFVHDPQPGLGADGQQEPHAKVAKVTKRTGETK